MNVRKQKVYENSARAVVEILMEHFVSGEKMSCDVPLSIFEETREMNGDMQKHHIFDRLVGTYKFIGVVIPYDYNNTMH